VTQRRQVEDERRRALERLQLAQDAARIGIHDYDITEGTIEWDERVRAIWGVPADEVVTYHTFLDGVHPEDRAATEEAIARALAPAGGGEYQAQYRVRSRADGSERWVQATGKAYFENGAARRLVGAVLDVSAQKRAELALRESEQRFRALADGTPVPIWVTDPEGGVEFVNRAYAEFFGVTQEKVRREGWQPLVHPEDGAYVLAFVEAVRTRTSFHAPARVWHASGEWRCIESWAQPRFAADGTFLGMAGSSPDVTELRRSREAAEASHVRLGLALAAGRVGIWEWDALRDRVLWSPEANEVLQIDAEAGEMTSAVALELVAAEDLPELREHVRAALAADGRYGHRFRIRRRDGKTRWVEITGRGQREEGGPLLRLLGTIRDVTEEHEAEAALRELDQRRTEFLAVLSHELRNPLAPMKNGLFLLRHAEPGSELERRAREVLQRQTEQLSRLVDDLLDVSRFVHGKIELRKQLVDAREIVRRACDDLRPAYEQRGVLLQYLEAVEPAWVDADPTRLVQLVGNLLNNGLKFTPPGGRVDVVLRSGMERCKIEVCDTGAGISADELRHIFTPFAQADRTRSRAQGGLGLGLALVRELAERHGGSVHARSDGIGRGAVFVVDLPLASRPERGDGARASGGPARPLSILVVEDNADAGATLAALLQLLGHSVRVVSHGAAAVEEFRRAASSGAGLRRRPAGHRRARGHAAHPSGVVTGHALRNRADGVRTAPRPRGRARGGVRRPPREASGPRVRAIQDRLAVAVLVLHELDAWPSAASASPRARRPGRRPRRRGTTASSPG
jgi:PAS domain S-box-containing protein